MDVQLYVYDLSRGLARQFSRSLLGIQIDAVYHTSVVLGGVEYMFGQGIQTAIPGSTHHGKPQEVVSLGRTDLPIELVLEYLESLKEIYTAESYDLFMKNCNNFSNDFAMFLVGKGIPEHITSLPQNVLNTPFGQMLRPQLDSAMRSITQAPVPANAQPAAAASRPQAAVNGGAKPPTSKVHMVTSLRDVERLLDSAKDRCAAIFFTSSTCAPCKLAYPAFDELAAEAGDKAVLIKVDINQAYEVASKYSIRATPTFMTFLRGQKEDEWSGANPSKLLGNVRMLIQIAFPPHPHSRLSLPQLLSTSLRPITYAKVPPLEKLMAKMGPASSDPIVRSIAAFIKARHAAGAAEAPLPNLSAYSTFLQTAPSLPIETLFPIIDLLRLSLLDTRVSSFFAEPHTRHTITTLLAHITSLHPCPYNLNLVTLQMCCNLFSSPLFTTHVLPTHPLSALLTTLLSTSFLDDEHPALRVAATSLAFNVAAAIHKSRTTAPADPAREEPPAEEQVELLASILEAVKQDMEQADVVKRLVVVVGLLVYRAPVDGEVWDLCRALDACGTVAGKEGVVGREAVVGEVRVLLGRGLEG